MGAPAKTVTSRTGLTAEITASAAVRRFDCGPVTLTLFIGGEVESGPANLFLRRRGAHSGWTALLGPGSPTRFGAPAAGRLDGHGLWEGIEYDIALVLAADEPVWLWQLRLRNTTSAEQELDLTLAQDVALAPYGAVRMNEYYVSQYVDHTPLDHPQYGTLVASRQNQAADGRHPWCLMGSLRQAIGFATDALDFYGLASRAGEPPPGMAGDLPSRRLQHEHSMVVLRDAPLALAPGQSLEAGFFGLFVADHPEATSDADLARVDAVTALPRSWPTASSAARAAEEAGAPTRFSASPLLQVADLDTEALQRLFPPPWRHEEREGGAARLSFFHGADRHVVLRAKELRVLRPHGQLLRTGRHLTPDESALTSTVWMSGVFHSLLAQGHVSINRFLSAHRSYLGLFRAQGLRVFLRVGAAWHLLGVPSAFEMAPGSCRWIYRHPGGELQLRSAARCAPHELTLDIEVTAGPDAAFLICQHVALNGDGGPAQPLDWRREGATLSVRPAPESDVGRRFPRGEFRITVSPDTAVARVGGDELLFLDGRSRQEPYLCIETAAVRRVSLAVHGHLVAQESQTPWRLPAEESLAPALTLEAPRTGEAGERAAHLLEMVPWYTQNALVHYLSPRGLEQYSGGGWGTRDVCQGPVEMLLALGRMEPLRDLVLRVMANQNPDGDWPQWFMFFERERAIRAGDSHGDVVFWPLVALAQYLAASGDAGVLEARVPFFDARGADAGERATVWEHVQRALTVIDGRRIAGTRLAAYGHGDWNDSLQPADPALRERMCSAWTVTLHFQALTSLASALRSIGRVAPAESLERQAAAVREDFQRLLLPDGVLTGYAVFDGGTDIRYLLHPRDQTTGVRYSSLAMIHAILEDMLTAQQTRSHLELIGRELSGPDGVRLFDRPLPYHGGPQRLFQRAESATYFGREIGLMYMHAHLRYAQALAHVGDAAGFFRALCQASPVGIRAIVPPATLRQANCYYSSSDAAFPDRYQARAQYARVRDGTIALDGGWRVYSSGAGIALGLTLRRFLGLTWESHALRLDPVIPPALNGLRVMMSLRGHPLEVTYHVGAAGCGVAAIVLNGRKLPFTRMANPHRTGAVRVTARAVLDRLTRSRNALAIDLG